MSSSSSSLLYAPDAFDVDVRALKVVLDLDVGIRVLEEPWKAILGILLSSSSSEPWKAVLGILSCHRLRHCYTEPLKGALGLLIKLSDVIVEHRTKHAEGRLCATEWRHK